MLKRIKNLPIMKYVFLAFGTVLFFMGIIVLLLSRESIGALVTTALGAMFLVGAIFYERFVNSKRISTRILRYMVVFGTCVWLVVCFALCIYGNTGKPTYTEDVLIVVGCGKGVTSKPSKTVEKRLDLAVEYLKTNPYAYVVVSGGGDNSILTEADVMAIYLRQHDIDQSRIIKETKSNTTYGRIKESKKMIDSRIDGEYRCVTITSASQALRTQLMSRKCGMRTSIVGVRSDFLHLPSDYMHETLALIKFVLFGY